MRKEEINSVDLAVLIDTMTNQMEYFDSAQAFVDYVLHYTDLQDEARIKNIWEAYWKIGAEDRMLYDDKDWTTFLVDTHPYF